MPMVNHIAQPRQVVAVDFREGNVAPVKDNLEFIKPYHRVVNLINYELMQRVIKAILLNSATPTTLNITYALKATPTFVLK